MQIASRLSFARSLLFWQMFCRAWPYFFGVGNMWGREIVFRSLEKERRRLVPPMSIKRNMFLYYSCCYLLSI